MCELFLQLSKHRVLDAPASEPYLHSYRTYAKRREVPAPADTLRHFQTNLRTFQSAPVISLAG